MDSESQQVTNQSTLPIDLQSENDTSRHLDLPYTSCILCRRAFLLETETSETFEAIFFCSDCKLVVLDDLYADATSRESSQRRLRRQARSGSSESIEDMFSQQFTEMISLVRQSHEAQQRSGYSVSSSRSRRWHHPLSDNGSDSLDPINSLFGDNDSIISFAGNGIESDAFLDEHGFIHEDIFIRRHDGGSNISSDIDIDPMQAGQDHWNSEDEVDDDGEWEEANVDEEASVDEEANVDEAASEFVGHDRQIDSIGSSPAPGSDRDTGNDGWLFMRTHQRRFMHYPNLFSDMEEPELPQFVGNADDYLDARGFEAFLEQLAETDSARRGPPPAATSCVRTLPRVVISKVHEKKNGSLVCAVCKDNLPVGTETNCLPCSHFYHPSCILPWLRTRNTCPVCRYELPTDDPDYEGGKRIRRRNRDRYGNHEENNVGESSSAIIHAEEADESHGFNQQERGQDDDGSDAEVEDGSNRQRRRRGWSYLAAAATPIVSIVGMALVMWLGASLSDRPNHGFDGHDSHEFARRNAAGGTQANRQRRWWSLF